MLLGFLLLAVSVGAEVGQRWSVFVPCPGAMTHSCLVLYSPPQILFLKLSVSSLDIIMQLTLVVLFFAVLLYVG